MRVENIYQTVPKPYTLLSLLQPKHKVYTVLDIKDAFFFILLSKLSQFIFAFEWLDPKWDIRTTNQGKLSQGFKNSPTTFNEALTKI